MKACMGGWCRIRSSCPNYTAADRREPADRLCQPGKDGERRPDVTTVRVMTIHKTTTATA